MKVYPLGTEQDPSGRRLRELMQVPNMHAIDCRLNPWSWRVDWQKDTLVQIYGERYHVAGVYLGNAKHPSNKMFPGKCEIELASPEVGIRGLIGYLKEACDLVLIDCYLDYSDSHLTEVVRLLQEKMPDVEIMLPKEKPIVMPRKGFVRVGAKVSLKKGTTLIPAVVVKTAFASTGDYLLCWLRVAQRNALDGDAWYVSEIGPVQSHKLVRRPTTIPELDILEAHYDEP